MATKFLMNVTVERSWGPIHVMMSLDNTVMDLVRTAVDLYVKEGRRPLLQFKDPKGFELHYSQYSLDCLDPEEKLKNLGSRNFFLCSRSSNPRFPTGLDPQERVINIGSPNSFLCSRCSKAESSCR